jgi:CMP-N-acetylneuraminic acid synthetase
VSGCNPLLKTSTIDNFINTYLNQDEEGLFAVIEKKNYFWNNEGELLNKWPEGQDLLNTKAVDTTYEAAHCLYASRIDSIGKGKWVGSWKIKNDPVLFPMNELEAFDIDYEWQFQTAQILYNGFRN